MDFSTITPSVFPTTDFTSLGNNSSNTSECPDPEAWGWLTAMQPAFMFTICVLGVIENLFVLAVFCLHKKACSVAEIYLGSLAAADLLFVSTLPFWAINIINDFEWPFGSLMCRLVNAGIKMNMYCSIYFLVLVSADRYVALVHTMSHGRMRRPKYAKLSCLAVWSLGILLSIPTLHFRSVKYFPQFSVTACILDYPSTTVRIACDILLTLLGFILPVSIIFYCTWKIIRALGDQLMDKFNVENSERKATVLILAVLVAFLFCWVPFHLVTFLHILVELGALSGCDLENSLDICNQIFTYLAFSNSVLNPILYVIVGKNFRKKVKELLVQITQTKKTRGSLTQSQTSSTLKTYM